MFDTPTLAFAFIGLVALIGFSIVSWSHGYQAGKIDEGARLYWRYRATDDAADNDGE